MARRIAALFLSLALLLGLTACDYQELSNVVFVIGIAIDPSPNSPEDLSITIELISMQKSSSEGEYESVNITSEGKTVFSALEHMIRLTSGRLDYAHCEVVIIQEDLAKKGIESFVDALYQSEAFPLTAALLIAHGESAGATLCAKPLTMRAQAFEISATISHENELQHFTKHTLHEVYNDIHHAPPIVSTLVALREEKEENKSVTVLSGGSLMQGDRVIERLDEEDLLYALLLGERIDRMLVPIPLPDGSTFIDVVLARSDVTAEPFVAENTINAQILVDMTLISAEVVPESMQGLDLAAHIEAVLNRSFTQLVEKVYGRWNCDMLNLMVALGRKHPRTMEDLLRAGVTADGYRLEVRTAVHDRPNDLMEE